MLASVETLARDELRRTRRFCYGTFIISLVTGAALPWLGGDPAMTSLLQGGLALSVLACAFLLYRARDPVQFRRPTTSLAWLALASTTALVVPYFGAFSPISGMIVLGTFFTALGKSTRLAYAAYVVSVVAHGVVGLLVITGITRDTGLIHAAYLTPHQQLATLGLVQLLFAMTLLMARTSRRTQLAAIEELEHEVRVLAHRDALLNEAREQLARVLRPGRGRFSDQRIGGYLLGDVIGRGAMGEVYEATGPAGVVAIKLMSQASLGKANHVLRFLRELRTAAAIEAPNIVKVLDVGEHPVPYLVMERLQGKTLSEILRAKPALTEAEIVELIRQIGAGITAARAAGVVHRDLKPQNVFRDREIWKILDFGIARALVRGDTITDGQIVGTPAYMAPEQAGGGSVDHATDLYALAATAYRALVGRPPFSAGEVAETLYRVVHTSPARPSDLAPRLSPQVDLVLAIGLAKQPTDRFATAEEFVDALEAALGSRLPLSVRRRGIGLCRAGAWSELRQPASLGGGQSTYTAVSSRP
jgi:serine/threonine-protein kinase